MLLRGGVLAQSAIWRKKRTCRRHNILTTAFWKSSVAGVWAWSPRPDLNLNRYVALKSLPDTLTKDRQPLECFQSEALAASGSTTPNIYRIYEIGEHDSQPFIRCKARSFCPEQVLGWEAHAMLKFPEAGVGAQAVDHRIELQPS